MYLNFKCYKCQYQMQIDKFNFCVNNITVEEICKWLI